MKYFEFEITFRNVSSGKTNSVIIGQHANDADEAKKLAIARIYLGNCEIVSITLIK